MAEMPSMTVMIEGLTKREVFALQIYCAQIVADSGKTSHTYEDAVYHATNLLKELDR